MFSGCDSYVVEVEKQPTITTWDIKTKRPETELVCGLGLLSLSPCLPGVCGIGPTWLLDGQQASFQSLPNLYFWCFYSLEDCIGHDVKHYLRTYYTIPHFEKVRSFNVLRWLNFPQLSIQILLIPTTRGGSGSKPRFLLAEENGAIPCNFFLVTKISLWSFQSPFTVEQSRLCFCSSVSSRRPFRGRGWLGTVSCCTELRNCLGEACSSRIVGPAESSSVFCS